MPRPDPPQPNTWKRSLTYFGLILVGTGITALNLRLQPQHSLSSQPNQPSANLAAANYPKFITTVFNLVSFRAVRIKPTRTVKNFVSNINNCFSNYTQTKVWAIAIKNFLGLDHTGTYTIISATGGSDFEAGMADGRTNYIVVPNLGIQMVTLTPEVKQRINADFYYPVSISESLGILLLKVIRQSAAATVGIYTGDVIVKANNQPISNPHKLQESVENYAVGSRLKLQICRDGQSLKFNLQSTVLSANASQNSS
ncbi:MAG: PDZ domain-containing protein [Mojavia pulchra JT2-VF2]|uniref:PDZ domain-containing protein n=1 Tax=Mojavia pulchra JT2-VF2 TaxID=287848 RepID=A0A951Q257_9NOST|nr:PDZ domain-containing protein [Mojavia pulchra JT2-VF2]